MSFKYYHEQFKMTLNLVYIHATLPTILQGLTVSEAEMTIITAHQRAKRPHTRDHQLEADSVTIKKVRLGKVGHAI